MEKLSRLSHGRTYGVFSRDKKEESLPTYFMATEDACKVVQDITPCSAPKLSFGGKP